MGKLVVTYADYDGEVSTASFPGSDLTAANILTETTEMGELRIAMADVLLGLELRYAVTAWVSPQAVGRATSPQAQREAKALVKYYDTVTFERGTLEMPCPDLTKQNPDYPGVFYLEGAANNHADWITFVAAAETYMLGAGGNAVNITEIIHVGRAL